MLFRSCEEGEGREGEREEEREEKGREETVPGFNSPNMVIDTIQATSYTTTIQQYLYTNTYVRILQIGEQSTCTHVCRAESHLHTYMYML